MNLPFIYADGKVQGDRELELVFNIHLTHVSIIYLMDYKSCNHFSPHFSLQNDFLQRFFLIKLMRVVSRCEFNKKTSWNKSSLTFNIEDMTDIAFFFNFFKRYVHFEEKHFEVDEGEYLYIKWSLGRKSTKTV